MLYAALLAVAVPRIQKRSRVSSEARSAVTGKVVDSFTNIMTVKLFGRRKDEDEYISEGYSRLNDAFMSQQRMNTVYVAGLTFLNAVFLVRDRRHGGVAVQRQPDRCRHHDHGASALHPDRLHVRLGRLRGHGHLRECGHGAGGHEDDLAPARDAGPARRQAAERVARRDPLRECQLQLRRRRHGDRRARPHHPAGREDRPRRPLRRRQDHARQPAPALLRAAGGPHPDRRPGHRRRHGGEPARADLRGDAGHVAAAPLDHARTSSTGGREAERGGDASRRRARPMPPTSSSGSSTGADGAGSTRMWASAA